MSHSRSASIALVWNSSDRFDPLVTALADKGYQVHSGSERDEVLELTLRKSPDVLLIYLQASGEAGYELCKTLRSLEVTQALPIIFIGNRNEKLELVKVLRCGGNDYIQQPMDEEESWLRLNRHLQTVHLLRQLQTERATLSQKMLAYDQILQQQQAIQASLTAENRNLQRLAFVDGLTQVANRRGFNQTISKMWQQAYKAQTPLSLLLCDIDYFKRYNDTYGHLEGDDCLQEIAQAMLEGAHRKGDYVARYGGEEFAVLLPTTDSEGAMQVASAIQVAVGQRQIAHRTSLVSAYVTLSIGICTLSPDSLNTPYEILIHGADEALYTAKLQGRDRAIANTYEGITAMDLSANAQTAQPTQPINSSPEQLLLEPPQRPTINQTINQSHSTQPVPNNSRLTSNPVAKDS